MSDNTSHPSSAPYGEQSAAQDPYAANPVVDESPALAPVAPELAGEGNDPEGVDATTFPAFKDLRRAMPAQRVRAKMELAKVATDLPKSIMAMNESGDFSDFTSEDMDGIANMLERVQTLVLDAAQSRDEMEEWLIAQEGAQDALMFAFEQYQAHLGN